MGIFSVLPDVLPHVRSKLREMTVKKDIFYHIIVISPHLIAESLEMRLQFEGGYY